MNLVYVLLLQLLYVLVMLLAGTALPPPPAQSVKWPAGITRLLFNLVEGLVIGWIHGIGR